MEDGGLARGRERHGPHACRSSHSSSSSFDTRLSIRPFTSSSTLSVAHVKFGNPCTPRLIDFTSSSFCRWPSYELCTINRGFSCSLAQPRGLKAFRAMHRRMRRAVARRASFPIALFVRYNRKHNASFACSLPFGHSRFELIG